MKHILKFFGLVRVKDINKYLDDEIRWYEQARKTLVDPNEILNENQTNKFSNYKECLKDVKRDIYLNFIF